MNLTRVGKLVPSGLHQPLKWGFGAAVLVALVSITIPNQYKSDARVLPADARGAGGVGGIAAAAAAVGVSIPGQESADAAYVDILNSRWLRENLLKTKFKFTERTWRFGTKREREATLLEFLETRNVDRAMSQLKGIIVVTRDLKSKLLTVSVETRSPELSQGVARESVRLLEEFVLNKASRRGGAKAAFAEKRLVESREGMAQAEADFRTFLDSNRNYQISTDPGVRLKGARLEAELKLRTQLVTTLAISREQALLEEKNDMPILNVLDEGNLPIEKSWPPRSVIVVSVFLIVAFSKILWAQRRSLMPGLAISTESSTTIS